MRNLQIILPMAGLGSRFANENYVLPKPLIKVDQKPMFVRALESLDNFNCDKKYIFIIRREHDEKFGLKSEIKKYIPSANIVVIDQITKGSVETCLKAKDLIAGDDGVLIMDCDLYFSSDEYSKLIEDVLAEGASIDGGLLSFQSDNSRYSYAKVEGSLVVETAEKKVISNNALVGAYFFSKGKTFIDVAEMLMNNQISKDIPEYYSSMLYNYIIKRGGK